MHLDVLDLRNFYYRTKLGRAAQRAIRDQVVRLWPPQEGQRVVGYGFAVPLLRPYLSPTQRVTALMPGPQGVMAWPDGAPNVAVLTHETHWPVAFESVDRLVLMHGLETSESPGALLDECWKVLDPGGRMLIVVPNRAGLWTRRDATPFGFGRPYSLGQLEAQLKSHGFVPERHLAALFTPPSSGRWWLRTAPLWEGVGRRLTSQFAGGVLMVEASKQVFAPTGGLRAKAPKRRILDGLAQPGGVPVPGR